MDEDERSCARTMLAGIMFNPPDPNPGIMFMTPCNDAFVAHIRAMTAPDGEFAHIGEVFVFEAFTRGAERGMLVTPRSFTQDSINAGREILRSNLSRRRPPDG